MMQKWLQARRAHSGMIRNRIPFTDSREWYSDSASIRHKTGGFFSIVGVRVQAEHSALNDWEQPIIDQPEIGILGFIVRSRGNGLEWLVQAKSEPGNVGLAQLAPTVQATFSNYSRLHGGAATWYLEYFLDQDMPLESDGLFSEQGTRFLRKFNRNTVHKIDHDLPIPNENFKWFSGQDMRRALGQNYVLNTDARSVIVTAPWSLLSSGELFAGPDRSSPFAEQLVSSYHRQCTPNCVYRAEAFVRECREKLKLRTDKIALKDLTGWIYDSEEIAAAGQSSGLVVRQYSVDAPDREQARWDQPLMLSPEKDEVILFCQRRYGILHFLLRASYEVGLTGGAELGPSFKQETASLSPAWLKDLVRAKRYQEHLAVEQSDEGGRFLDSCCRYAICEIDDAWRAPETDTGNLWVTLAELEKLCQAPGLLTNEARSVVSLLLSEC